MDSRLKEIEEKIKLAEKYRDRIEPYEYVEDMTELLSRLQIAEEENKKLREALDKAHVLLERYESMLS